MTNLVKHSAPFLLKSIAADNCYLQRNADQFMPWLDGCFKCIMRVIDRSLRHMAYSLAHSAIFSYTTLSPQQARKMIYEDF